MGGIGAGAAGAGAGAAGPGSAGFVGRFSGTDSVSNDMAMFAMASSSDGGAAAAAARSSSGGTSSRKILKASTHEAQRLEGSFSNML